MDLHRQIRDRYPFFWVVGDTLLGKTQWVLAQFRNPFVHFGGINWSKYDPTRNDAIVFDDVSTRDRSMDGVVMENKHIFQASGRLADVNNSSTNCYAIRVDVEGKPIVILSNSEHRPHSDWVLSNCYYVEFISAAYGPPVGDTWWRNMGMQREALPEQPVVNLTAVGGASGSGSGNLPALQAEEGGGELNAPNTSWIGNPAVGVPTALPDSPPSPRPPPDTEPP
jgi:hypothetical protein